ncbi:ribosomal protein L28e, partial [Polyplosphaeria fusca]
TIPADLIWEITRGHSSTLVKRNSGRDQFSRDKLNLRNKYGRKHEGLVADKAIGIQPSSSGGITLTTKKANKQNAPASQLQESSFGSSTSTRKVYKAIVNSTAKRGYRPDLRQDAVARASALRKGQKDPKADKPTKARGAKAKKA